MTSSRNALPPGYQLHWYVIRDILGQGGFGITYLADDTNLNHPVAIKEFLPVEMAVRDQDASVHPVTGEQGDDFQWGLERFISEAQTLARFHHNNIVRVFTVFSENNTAYMIMEYEKGQGLHEILKTRGRLPEREALQIILPILDGLERVHAAGFIHRDIKPPNIFIREDGSPVLLDFGSARQSLGEHTRTLTTMVSPGYAPFEQYVSKSDKQGPWTDIYGLGATMYRAVTGKSPPNAVDRSEALLQTGKDIYVPCVEICSDGYSGSFLRAIDHALAFRAGDRPVDIDGWRGEMNATIGPEPVPDEDETELLPQPVVPPTGGGAIRLDARAARPAPTPTVSAPARRRLSRPLVLLLLILAVALVLLIVPIKRRQAPTQSITAAGKPAEKATAVKPVVAKRTENVQPKAATALTPASTATNTGAMQPAESQSITAPAAASPPAVSQASTVSAATQAPELISAGDRRRLEALSERLRENPRDRRAERQMQRLFSGYEGKVREALQQGDLARAESYINELSELAPNNRRLQKALDRIRAARARRLNSGN